MKMHYRTRRPLYGNADRKGNGLWMRRLIAMVVALVLLFLLWKGITGIFGFFMGGQERSVTLRLEGSEPVDMAFEGQDFQAGEDGASLQSGDAVRTPGGSHATILFADGTKVRLDEQTSVTLLESRESGGGVRQRLELLEGAVWVMTPQAADAENARAIVTPRLEIALTDSGEVYATPRSLVVYQTVGAGVAVRMKGGSTTLPIGEGQQFSLSEDAASDAPLDQFRSAFSLSAFRNPFVLQSRRLLAGTEDGAQASGDLESALTVTAPKDGEVVPEETVRVTGRVTEDVKHVRINGQEITIDDTDGSFVADIAMLSDSFELHIEALDSAAALVEEVTRTVTKGQTNPSSSAVGAPEITSPVKTGETFYTLDNEVVLRGTAPAGTAQIIVNDYTLQLFDPSKGTWSYLARTDLGNLVSGQNTYDVYAVDAEGKRSNAARITVVQGQTGPSSTAGGSASSTGAAPQNNAPLTPGTLSVTAPTPGTTHTETGTGFLLEGRTSAQTDSIWVNDYRLQLYRPGILLWNYIADVDLLNLKPGQNVYTIIARNSQGQVLNRLVYTVTYEPR